MAKGEGHRVSCPRAPLHLPLRVTASAEYPRFPPQPTLLGILCATALERSSQGKTAPIPLPPLFLLLPQQQQSTGAVNAEKELHFESSFFLTSTHKTHLLRTSGKNESFKDCTCMSEKVYRADLGIYYLISFF